MYFSGEYFSASYTRKQMWGEVDRFVKGRYGEAAMDAIMFHYTDWAQQHPPPEAAGTYANTHYDRAKVSPSINLL